MRIWITGRSSATRRESAYRRVTGIAKALRFCSAALFVLLTSAFNVATASSIDISGLNSTACPTRLVTPIAIARKEVPAVEQVAAIEAHGKGRVRMRFLPSHVQTDIVLDGGGNNNGRTTNIPGMVSMARLGGCVGDDCAK